MTPPLSEAQRMELLRTADEIIRVGEQYMENAVGKDIIYAAFCFQAPAALKLARFAKSQLSRQPEAAEVAVIRARHEALERMRNAAYPGSSISEAMIEHQDRATLLNIVDAQARALSVRSEEK